MFAERSRQMINDVVSNKNLNIDPTSLRKGEWILTWDYNDRPEIRSIEISYMKASFTIIDKQTIIFLHGKLNGFAIK